MLHLPSGSEEAGAQDEGQEGRVGPAPGRGRLRSAVCGRPGCGQWVWPPAPLAPLAGVGGAEGGLNRNGVWLADVARRALQVGMELSWAGGAGVWVRG